MIKENYYYGDRMGIRLKWHSLAVTVLLIAGIAISSSATEFNNSIAVTTVENGDTVDIRYLLPGVTLSENQEGYTTVSLGNSLKTDVAGNPRLPFIPLRLAVPAGKELQKSEITILSEDTITISQPVEPAKKAMILSRMPAIDDSEEDFNPHIYQSEKFWPGEQVRLNGEIRKKGNPILSFRVNPVHYSPVLNRVTSVREMSVRIIWKDERTSRSSEKTVIRRRELDKKEAMIENSPVSAPASRSSSVSANYLVITNNELKNSSLPNNLQALLAIHQERGLTTKIMTVEEITAAYAGIDQPEQIRNAIIDHYNNNETEFVLLAGDSKVVPPRYYFMNDAPDSVSGEPMKINILNDTYYSCLDGTQNSDGDEYWGEKNDGVNGALPDVHSEVYLGRMAVETVEELSNVIEKTVAHLKGNSTKKVLLIGEHLGFGGEAEYAEESMVEVWNGGIAKGYSTRSFAHDPSIEKDSLFDRDHKDYFGREGWSSYQLTSLLNTNSIGVINHLGHGLPHQNMKYYLDSRKDRPYVAPPGLKEIVNTAPVFVNSQACLSGKFDYETISEYLTVVLKSGYWGGVWNANFGIGQKGSTNSGSQFMQRQFWHAYFGLGYTEVGKLNAYADEVAFEKSVDDWQYRWVTYVTHLFGDPAAPMTIGSETPIVSIAPFKIKRSNTFDISWFSNVRANPGDPVEPVKVELVKENSVVFTIDDSLETFDYTWNVPDSAPSGDGFTIRVTCLSTGASAESENIYIDLETKLTLLSPTGGELFVKGDTIDITWESNFDGDVSLQLLQNDQFYETIVTGIPASQNSVSWRVPKNYLTGEYKLRLVSDQYREWLYTTTENTFTFETPVVQQFPYSLDCNDLEEGDEVYDWAQLKSNSVNWTVMSGAAPSRLDAVNKSGPESDASGDGKYVLLDVDWDGVEKRADLASPFIDFSNLENPKLSMKLHMWAENPTAKMGGFYVFLASGGKFDLLVNKTASTTSPDEWVDITVDLTPYVSSEKAYIHIAANTIGIDMAIDDFVITGDNAGNTADSNAVAVVTPLKNGTNRGNGAVFPGVLQENDSKVTVKINNNAPFSGVSYKLFDVLGNRLINGTAVPKGNNHWDMAMPTHLASGSYLLYVYSTEDNTALFRTIIGKKE